MKNKRINQLIVVLSLLFIAINAFLIFEHSNALTGILISVSLLVGLWVFFSPTNLFFFLALLAPLSFSLSEIVPDLAFDFWVPTEPILVFLLLMLLLKTIQDRSFQKELLYHPVFVAIIFFLGWLLVSVVPSELPVVSLKYFLVRLWYIGTFFYLSYILFKKNHKNIYRFFVLFLVGMFIASMYAILNQASQGLLNHHAAYRSASPLFVDHTSYGATLAFFIPFVGALSLNAKKRWLKRLGWLLVGYFTFALILSYSRAAWLSLAFALGILFLIHFRIKLRTVLISILALVGLFFAFQEQIFWHLEKNTTDSSGKFTEHLKSMYNIRSDASNLERINRWDCAWSMFQERPVFGWGPGTYQFVYAPFQKPDNLTIISTNQGDWGNAHSEYLGLLSEAGLLAPFAFIAIWALTFWVGFRLIKHPKISREHRNFIIASIMGLSTYVSHAFLNNFLEIDKLAALFWGSIALILAIEFHLKTLDAAEANDKLVEVETED